MNIIAITFLIGGFVLAVIGACLLLIAMASHSRTAEQAMREGLILVLIGLGADAFVLLNHFFHFVHT